jgi:DNA modification methylase
VLGHESVGERPRETPEPFAESDPSETPSWSVYHGDSRWVLEQFGEATVDCVVASPPYYWQRDYEAGELEIGKEPSVAGYVGAIVDVMAEARKVLRPTGVAFLNIGDTFYNAKGRPHGHDPKHSARLHARKQLRAVDGPGLGLPCKSLIGITWRVAPGLQEEGWTFRSDIICWYRKSPLGEPTSKNRPWRNHEHVFLLAKSVKYHFDRTALAGAEDVWEIGPERYSPTRRKHYPSAENTRRELRTALMPPRR